MKYLNFKNLLLINFLFPSFMFSQIREINKIDNEINTQIETIKKEELKKKILNKKIDSLNEIRFHKYDELIKYYNKNSDKQYFLNKADSLRKPKPFRESLIKNINKSYLNTNQNSFSTILNFTITPDGKLQNVNATGENSEFNTLSIIALYKLLTEFEPFYPDKSKVLKNNQSFNLPIKLSN